MKAVVVQFSDTDTKCLSALRHTGGCWQCDYVESCKCPQSKKGRLINQMSRVVKLKANKKQLTKDIKIAEKIQIEMEQEIAK